MTRDVSFHHCFIVSNICSYVSLFWNKRSFIIYLIMIYLTFFTTITINWLQIDKQIKKMNNFLKAVKKSVNGFLFQSNVLLLWINQNIFLLWFPIVVGFEEIFWFFFVKNKLMLLNNRGRLWHSQYNSYRIIYETILCQWITASWKWT